MAWQACITSEIWAMSSRALVFQNFQLQALRGPVGWAASRTCPDAPQIRTAATAALYDRDADADIQDHLHRAIWARIRARSPHSPISVRSAAPHVSRNAAGANKPRSEVLPAGSGPSTPMMAPVRILTLSSGRGRTPAGPAPQDVFPVSLALDGGSILRHAIEQVEPVLTHACLARYIAWSAWRIMIGITLVVTTWCWRDTNTGRPAQRSAPSHPHGHGN